jgi:hypothetical protein
MRALLLILFALLSFPALSSPYIKVANNGTDLPDSALLGTGPSAGGGICSERAST